MTNNFEARIEALEKQYAWLHHKLELLKYLVLQLKEKHDATR